MSSELYGGDQSADSELWCFVVRSPSTSLGSSSDLFLLKIGVIFLFTLTNIVELIHFTSVKLGLCSY